MSLIAGRGCRWPPRRDSVSPCAPLSGGGRDTHDGHENSPILVFFSNLLVCVDLEATGIWPGHDRIVQIAAASIFPDGSVSTWSSLVNPEQPIPPAATAIHGITDERVASAPTYAQLAPTVAALLSDCDLTGYNVERFDRRLLAAESRRAGFGDPTVGALVIDVYTMFVRREPRSLDAALQFYDVQGGQATRQAHDASSDVEATVAVLVAQLNTYSDLPRTVDELHSWLHPSDPNRIDADGKLVNVGDPPALPGRPSVFDVSGSNVRNSPREPLKHHAGESSMNNYRSLNHTKWECQYHVVFIPKYRRKTLYGGLRHYLGDVLRRLAEQRESRVEEGHLLADHVHMLVSIPPKYSVAQVIGYIKGKSAIHIAREFAGRPRNFVGQHFWARGYYVSTVGQDERVVREYVQQQEREDRRLEQLRLEE